jgi:hypothetical protein
MLGDGARNPVWSVHGYWHGCCPAYFMLKHNAGFVVGVLDNTVDIPSLSDPSVTSLTHNLIHSSQTIPAPLAG